MSRFDELRRQLRFERAHRDARQPLFPLARKLLRVPFQAAMFVLFNFGSSFKRAPLRDAARPRDPEIQPLLTIEQWPQRDGRERGLPLSDDVAQAVLLRDFEWLDDPLFAMREIRRVARHGATVEVTLSGGRWIDPLQRRVATPEHVTFFTAAAESERARVAGADQLFDFVRAEADRVVLSVSKAPAAAPHPRRIDLGCGTSKEPDHIGIDVFALPGVDIVRDVERHGLPFSDDTIVHVHASHFLEHVRDLLFVMEEIHRVCCDGAEVDLIVPTLLGPWAAADPTHVRIFNARSFEYFTSAMAGEESAAAATTGFEILSQSVSTSLHVRLRVVKSLSAARTPSTQSGGEPRPARSDR